MKLQDFFEYKNRLMHDLLTNETIVKLLDDSATLETAPSLVYKNVFPYQYIPDTVEHGLNFICCDVDIQKQSYRSTQSKKTFYNPVLYIWIMVPKDKMRLPNGGIRTDRLCAEIAKEIIGSMYYGIGRLELESVRRFVDIIDFQGKQLTFTLKEWNDPHLGVNEDIPANRKRWS
jgi:hypothetical protein